MNKLLLKRIKQANKTMYKDQFYNLDDNDIIIEAVCMFEEYENAPHSYQIVTTKTKDNKFNFYLEDAETGETANILADNNTEAHKFLLDNNIIFDDITIDHLGLKFGNIAR